MEVANIFSLKNYRSYLKAWLRTAKITKKSNLNQMAEAAQVHATFLSQVLLGKKNLSLEQAALLSSYVGLTKIEREYLFALVQIERSGNTALKSYWLEKKTEIEKEKNKLSTRFQSHSELTLEQKAIYYSSWLFSAVRLFTDHPTGRSLVSVAEAFQINFTKAEEILNFLVETGLCTETKGSYFLGAAHIHIPNESPLVTKHHINWRTRAVTSMDTRDKDELFFTAPMIISRNDFENLREKLNQTIKQTIETAKASPPEELVCLTIDFFRALRIPPK